MPETTVLIPVYNCGVYLKEALDSILAQSYKKFELLSIDDASTDNTLQIIRSYKDKRIRFYKNDRNIGIVKSRS